MSDERDNDGVWERIDADAVIAGETDDAALADVVALLRARAAEPPPAVPPALARVFANGLPPVEPPRVEPVVSWRARLASLAAASLAAKFALGVGVATAAVTGMAVTHTLPEPVDRGVSRLVQVVTQPFGVDADFPAVPDDAVPTDRVPGEVPASRPPAPVVLPPVVPENGSSIPAAPPAERAPETRPESPAPQAPGPDRPAPGHQAPAEQAPDDVRPPATTGDGERPSGDQAPVQDQPAEPADEQAPVQDQTPQRQSAPDSGAETAPEKNLVTSRNPA